MRTSRCRLLQLLAERLHRHRIARRIGHDRLLALIAGGELLLVRQIHCSARDVEIEDLVVIDDVDVGARGGAAQRRRRRGGRRCAGSRGVGGLREQGRRGEGQKCRATGNP